MKNKEQQLKELHEIRSLMERSSRFLSLSGLSGISTGIIALLGAFAAFYFLRFGAIKYDEHFQVVRGDLHINFFRFLIIDALIILILALTSALFFMWRKAGKAGKKLWDHTARKLFIHFSIPLITGGLFSILLIYYSHFHLIAATTLIFYGLALVNAGKYTFSDIQYLGILEILLGLLAGIFLHYGLLFWVIGFGLLHILYGTIMYYKYEKSDT